MFYLLSKSHTWQHKGTSITTKTTENVIINLTPQNKVMNVIL